MPTRRELIYDMLKEGEYTAQELAHHFKIEMKFIIDDLDHLARTLKPKKISVKPAYCKSCGFRFEERSRLKSPSKCPKCREERIQPSLLHIIKIGSECHVQPKC